MFFVFFVCCLFVCLMDFWWILDGWMMCVNYHVVLWCFATTMYMWRSEDKFGCRSETRSVIQPYTWNAFLDRLLWGFFRFLLSLILPHHYSKYSPCWHSTWLFVGRWDVRQVLTPMSQALCPQSHLTSSLLLSAADFLPFPLSSLFRYLCNYIRPLIPWSAFISFWLNIYAGPWITRRASLGRRQIASAYHTNLPYCLCS